MKKAGEKIKTLDELIEIITSLKSEGKKIVFTNGCFDIIHTGHIYLLEKAKSFGDKLIVALNTDDSVKKIKGPSRPAVPENDRALIIASLMYTDYVTFFRETEPSRIISLLKPDIHVKGADYKPDDFNNMPEARIIKEYGGEIRIVRLMEGYSTTNLINKVSNPNK